MISRPVLHGLAAGLLLAAVVACSERRDPIVLEEGTITIENQTDTEWRNVRVVVNDYFNGGTPSLAPGQRLTAPLGKFETGFGQRFDRGRMSVYKIEVLATDAAGAPVKLMWGRDRTAQ